MIKKMLTELKELQLTENFSKEIENINKNQSELKNTTNEKYAEISSKIRDAEEQISNLEDGVMESTQTDQQKKKKKREP